MAGRVEDISAVELKRLLDSGSGVQLIDVREPSEHAVARIPGAVLIPLGEVRARAGEIDPAKRTVVHCRSGVRSATAIALLRQDGFTGEMLNLRGGILAWSAEVDPTVPQY